MSLDERPDVMSARIEAVLAQVAVGTLAPPDAAGQLRELVVRDLGFAQVDLQRASRRGRPETIYAEGKTPEQVSAIARAMAEGGQNVLITRANEECRARVHAEFQGYDVRESGPGRAMLIHLAPPPTRGGVVGVVCAGTSDLPVAEEAAFVAQAFGSPVERLTDVGVAGIHRLLRQLDWLRRPRVLIVVAGMEGALPSVVAGLVEAPVIAVPTSVGYGAGAGGIAALMGMLSSCSPGIGVVNIDNGYGAAYLADAINATADAAVAQ